MPRHALNRTDRPFQTAAERAEAGFGKTHTERLGTDVQLPFGYCALSLKAALDPVASPHGIVFEREFILNSLVKQKEDMKRVSALLAEQKARDALEEQVTELQAKRRKIQAFEQQELGSVVLSTAANSIADLNGSSSNQTSAKSTFRGNFSLSNIHANKLEQDEKKNVGDRDTSNFTFTSSRQEYIPVNLKQARQANFWVASDAPEAKKKRIDEEKDLKQHTECPITGKKLRLKDLIPIKFEIYDQKLFDDGGGRGMYCCSVTKKPITHQKVTLIKPSGIVCFNECVEKTIRKDMKCPVSGKDLRESDLVELIPGNTGFCSHNSIEAKSYKQMRTAAMINADRTGQCGLKGTMR
ncbi:unnamed protein product [Amoebophrya sp. A120]|nr:unnamed protein product [Amoebophrya sp. A120]|eukprot:GSA120T00014383001.1